MGVGEGVGVRVSVCGCDTFSSPLLFCKRAALQGGVTDEGLRALASAGCGEMLTSLILFGEVLVFLFLSGWCVGVGVGVPEVCFCL